MMEMKEASPSVKKLFGEVAPKYDLVTRGLSFGLEARIKRQLVSGINLYQVESALDLATGTGDLAYLIQAKYPEAKIIAIDLSPEMLSEAFKKQKNETITFRELDMANLISLDLKFDVITGGYALRNAPDLNQLVRNLANITKPKAICAFFEFSKFENPILQKLQYLILQFWCLVWSLILHQKLFVYNYIPQTLSQFPNQKDLIDLFQGNGFKLIKQKRYFGGMLQNLWFEKIS